MRVLIVSWEYPPVLVGGLGRHVHMLARKLSERGEDVTVLCRQFAGTDASTHPISDGVVDGVRIIRVPEDPPHLTFDEDLVAWILAMGHSMVRAGHDLMLEWVPDVVHAHDWLVAHPAIALADAADAPLVTTIHATESGRNGGHLPDRLNRQVHSIEWWLANRSDGVVTCSTTMRREVSELFGVDLTTIALIHNGIEQNEWVPTAEEVERARAWIGEGDGPLLLYFGRLEWEKGIHHAIAALPRIRESYPGVRLLVVGDGQQRAWLKEQAWKHDVHEAVTFVDPLQGEELAAVVAMADVAVLPSLYEPFGMTALEAAAAGTPIVASDTGGLREVVLHERTGLRFSPGDVPGLAAAVRAVLVDPAAAEQRARTAKLRLGVEFDWTKIADRTVERYRAARRDPRVLLGRPAIPGERVLIS